MSTSDLPPLEAFHNTFYYFVEGISLLASDAVRQRQVVGGPHIAWELQSDVRDHGEAVLKCAGSFLTDSQRAGITSLLERVEKLSPEALRSDDYALTHPQWADLRHKAAHLLQTLAGPIAENRAFFKRDG